MIPLRIMLFSYMTADNTRVKTIVPITATAMIVAITRFRFVYLDDFCFAIESPLLKGWLCFLF